MSEPVGYSAKPPRIKPPPALVTAVGVGALLATVYPPVAERVLAMFGVRTVALGLLVLGFAWLLAWQRIAPRRVPIYQRATLLVLPAAAAATGDILFLRLVPAAIQALIAALFVVSLREGGSLFYDAAKSLHPYAPDFIAPYCRKSTIVFAGDLRAARGRRPAISRSRRPRRAGAPPPASGSGRP